MEEPLYRTSPRGSNALDQVEQQGFRLPLKPSDHPELPVDLSDLSPDELMSALSLFTAWADYASAQVGLAVIAEREVERELDVVEARAWQGVEKATSVSAAKAQVAAHKGVIDTQRKLDATHAYRRLVSDIADRYERDAAVLSRELTRRTSEPSQRRKDRFR